MVQVLEVESGVPALELGLVALALASMVLLTSRPQHDLHL